LWGEDWATSCCVRAPLWPRTIAQHAARSKADFASKLGIVEEEADESAFWMELIVESGVVPHRRLQELLEEANQLIAIVVASRKTVARDR